MNDPKIDVATVLVDLDGTLYQRGGLVPGGVEALAELGRRGVAHRFVTNTTSRPASAVLEGLAAMGLRAEPALLFTAPQAARRYLLAEGLTRCHFLVAPPLMEDFAGVEVDDDSPDAVVLGDAGEGFTYERLTRAFRLLLGGARLVTLARNRYFLAADGLALDVGPFTAALEYASGAEAVLVGKPAPEFFRQALASAGGVPGRAAVVGDDLEGDVGGAQAAGMWGILVRTGKFREEALARSGIEPDAVIDSLADLPKVIRG
jgi:HAD superfamily hydrolase (TIGR01458 family)